MALPSQGRLWYFFQVLLTAESWRGGEGREPSCSGEWEACPETKAGRQFVHFPNGASGDAGAKSRTSFLASSPRPTIWETIKEDSEGTSGLCGEEHHNQLVMSAMALDGEVVVRVLGICHFWLCPDFHSQQGFLPCQLGSEVMVSAPGQLLKAFHSSLGQILQGSLFTL